MTDTFTTTDRYGDPVWVAQFGAPDAVFLTVVDGADSATAALQNVTDIRDVADALNAAADAIEAFNKREGI